MGGNSHETLLRRSQKFAVRHPMVFGFGMLITATLMLRLGWGWSIGRSQAAYHAVIAARGEPVVPEDLVIRPVPADDDAWPLIQKAAAADNRASPMNSNDIFPAYPPFGTAWERSARASESANAAVFTLVRQARSRSRIQLRSTWPSPLFKAVFTSYNDARQVLNTVGDGALHQHVRSNDREAVERLLDMVHIADLIGQGDETLLGQLIAKGLGSLACHRIMVIAPGLATKDANVRSRIVLLIDRLTDETRQSPQLARALAFERVFYVDFYRWQANGAAMLNPLAEQEIARKDARHALWRDAAMAASLPDAIRILAQIPEERPKPDREMARLMGQTVPPEQLPRYSRWYEASSAGISIEHVMNHHFRTMSARRFAAVSLAMQLYRSDHDGQWPGQLGELVPKYLRAVPADPFRADGRQMGYVVVKGGILSGSDRPLLYFDAGDIIEGAIEAAPMYDWVDFSGRGPPRQYRDVARWPRLGDVARETKEQEAERQQRKNDADDAARRQRMRDLIDGIDNGLKDDEIPKSPD